MYSTVSQLSGICLLKPTTFFKSHILETAFNFWTLMKTSLKKTLGRWSFQRFKSYKQNRKSLKAVKKENWYITKHVAAISAL